MWWWVICSICTNIPTDVKVSKPKYTMGNTIFGIIEQNEAKRPNIQPLTGSCSVEVLTSCPWLLAYCSRLFSCWIILLTSSSSLLKKRSSCPTPSAGLATLVSWVRMRSVLQQIIHKISPCKSLDFIIMALNSNIYSMNQSLYLFFLSLNSTLSPWVIIIMNQYISDKGVQSFSK